MSVTRCELTEFLDGLFAEPKFEDRSNNGLQVEGAPEIDQVAFAVDACEASFMAAADCGAQFLFCHHGISWGGGIKRFTGSTARRFRWLFKDDISLYAMHLPLDAHPVIGNNAKLAEIVGLTAKARQPFFDYNGGAIGCCGKLAKTTTAAALAKRLGDAIGSDCRIIAAEPERKIRSVGIISGAGADGIDEAVQRGLDCLITGECGHAHFHPAEEAGVALLLGGHYATETVGPKAVMAAVQKRFPKLACRWIDLPTGL